MELDYRAIGGRIARCRKKLQFTQAQVAELCDISDQYLSNIERAVSIPSTEVVMRLAAALNTTPDEFLVGTTRRNGAEHWQDIAQRLQTLSKKQLELTDHFISWVSEQDI